MTLRAVQRAQDFLDATQNSDDGWGYRVGNSSITEPTALVVIARPSQAAWEKGVAWLLRTQRDDGGWGMNLEDDDSNWLTAWATWALLDASTEESLPAARQGIEWMLADVPAEHARDPVSVIRLIGVDPTLDGWPWQRGGAAWVEPTALSLLASFAADSYVGGMTDHPLVRKGVAFLRDRVCTGGGWNVGAPFNFGQQMPPTPHCTALTLLTLQIAGTDRDDPIIVESLVAMRQLLTPPVAAGSLAWGMIALGAWQADDTSLRDRLLRLQSDNGGWENSPYATASALLALQAPTTIFSRGG